MGNYDRERERIHTVDFSQAVVREKRRGMSDFNVP